MEPKQPLADHAPAQGLSPLTAASRQRLQKVFEHGQRCAEKKDFDYANQLFSQCVAEDPGSILYLQHFFANLQNKYGDNKKGAKLAGLKIKSHRAALRKAASKGKWEAALQAGCAALALNPWDISSLLAMATAYDELQIDECQLFYLRWAMGVDANDPAVNRQAAFTLQRMGQFDQAIACWQRVAQAKPQDEEARQAISRLSVEKTIHQGGYSTASLGGGEEGNAETKVSVAQFSKQAKDGGGAEESLSPEERLKAAIIANPTDVESYLQLADICMGEARYSDAEYVLTRASDAAGSADFRVHERLEDVLLRRAAQQLAIAEQQAQQDPSKENKLLAKKIRRQVNQVELEVYVAKSDRDPNNTQLKYELGTRLKNAGKHKEAITAFQGARGDPKQRAKVLLELGECFQRIEQYKLALSNYEEAIEACTEQDSETRRLALYRAGVLSTGMKELDRADRHLTELAGLDFSYRDVADRLDKLNQLRDSG